MSKRLKLLTVMALAVTLATGCSTQDMLRVAQSKDPGAAIQAMAQSRVSAYKYDPELVIKDIKRAQIEYNRLLGKLQKESGAKWGKKESAEVPTRTRYVKYTEGYKNRVIVDFDAGTMLIEHLEEEGVKDKLHSAVVSALMTPGDPRAVDVFSDKPVEMTGTPYLQGLIADQNNRLIDGRSDVERYAAYLVENKLQSREIDVNGASKSVRFVRIAMVNNHVEKKAVRFLPSVRKYSESTRVSRSLIFAVMKTESGFNPFAVSSAPAFGLMQLVPSSGGRDAYRKAKGKDEAPTREYLFDSENNIELGSTYLAVLMNDSPLKNIRDPISREYCAIAAYNTGAGNVFRAFALPKAKASERQRQAIERINALKPDEVYQMLKSSLPYEETRNYIVKVVSAKKRYAAM